MLECIKYYQKEIGWLHRDIDKYFSLFTDYQKIDSMKTRFCSLVMLANSFNSCLESNSYWFEESGFEDINYLAYELSRTIGLVIAYEYGCGWDVELKKTSSKMLEQLRGLKDSLKSKMLV